MNETHFLPSEIGRLVLGYLHGTGCPQAAKEFLHESPALHEYRSTLAQGFTAPLLIGGQDLVTLLNRPSRTPERSKIPKAPVPLSIPVALHCSAAVTQPIVCSHICNTQSSHSQAAARVTQSSPPARDTTPFPTAVTCSYNLIPITTALLTPPLTSTQNESINPTSLPAASLTASSIKSPRKSQPVTDVNIPTTATTTVGGTTTLSTGSSILTATTCTESLVSRNTTAPQTSAALQLAETVKTAEKAAPQTPCTAQSATVSAPSNDYFCYSDIVVSDIKSDQGVSGDIDKSSVMHTALTSLNKDDIDDDNALHIVEIEPSDIKSPTNRSNVNTGVWDWTPFKKDGPGRSTRVCVEAPDNETADVDVNEILNELFPLRDVVDTLAHNDAWVQELANSINKTGSTEAEALAEREIPAIMNITQQDPAFTDFHSLISTKQKRKTRPKKKDVEVAMKPVERELTCRQSIDLGKSSKRPLHVMKDFASSSSKSSFASSSQDLSQADSTVVDSFKEREIPAIMNVTQQDPASTNSQLSTERKRETRPKKRDVKATMKPVETFRQPIDLGKSPKRPLNLLKDFASSSNTSGSTSSSQSQDFSHSKPTVLESFKTKTLFFSNQPLGSISVQLETESTKTFNNNRVSNQPLPQPILENANELKIPQPTSTQGSRQVMAVRSPTQEVPSDLPGLSELDSNISTQATTNLETRRPNCELSIIPKKKECKRARKDKHVVLNTEETIIPTKAVSSSNFVAGSMKRFPRRSPLPPSPAKSEMRLPPTPILIKQQATSSRSTPRTKVTQSNTSQELSPSAFYPENIHNQDVHPQPIQILMQQLTQPLDQSNSQLSHTQNVQTQQIDQPVEMVTPMQSPTQHGLETSQIMSGIVPAGAQILASLDEITPSKVAGIFFTLPNGQIIHMSNPEPLQHLNPAIQLKKNTPIKPNLAEATEPGTTNSKSIPMRVTRSRMKAKLPKDAASLRKSPIKKSGHLVSNCQITNSSLFNSSSQASNSIIQITSNGQPQSDNPILTKSPVESNLGKELQSQPAPPEFVTMQPAPVSDTTVMDYVPETPTKACGLDMPDNLEDLFSITPIKRNKPEKFYTPQASIVSSELLPRRTQSEPKIPPLAQQAAESSIVTAKWSPSLKSLVQGISPIKRKRKNDHVRLLSFSPCTALKKKRRLTPAPTIPEQAEQTASPSENSPNLQIVLPLTPGESSVELNSQPTVQSKPYRRPSSGKRFMAARKGSAMQQMTPTKQNSPSSQAVHQDENGTIRSIISETITSTPSKSSSTSMDSSDYSSLELKKTVQNIIEESSGELAQAIQQLSEEPTPTKLSDFSTSSESTCLSTSDEERQADMTEAEKAASVLVELANSSPLVTPVKSPIKTPKKSDSNSTDRRLMPPPGPAATLDAINRSPGSHSKVSTTTRASSSAENKKQLSRNPTSPQPIHDNKAKTTQKMRARLKRMSINSMLDLIHK